MTKQLTSAEAAAIVYGKPGTKVINRHGQDVWVDESGNLRLGGNTTIGTALCYATAPFTLPSDPDELPEDVTKALDDGGYLNHCVHDALAALWRHIKPEAKR